MPPSHVPAHVLLHVPAHVLLRASSDVVLLGRFLARVVALGTVQCALLYNAAHCATQLTKKNVDAATQNEDHSYVLR